MIQAELDLSSICAITLTRGLDLLRSGDMSAGLAQIASGNYRLLPYALEFWIEHCSRYAVSRDSLEVESPLTYHLTRLHDAHEHCLRSVKGAEELQASGEATISQPEDRLRPFAGIPAQNLMKEVLRIRLIASQCGCENGKGTCTHASSNPNPAQSEFPSL